MDVLKINSDLIKGMGKHNDELISDQYFTITTSLVFTADTPQQALIKTKSDPAPRVIGRSHRSCECPPWVLRKNGHSFYGRGAGSWRVGWIKKPRAESTIGIID